MRTTPSAITLLIFSNITNDVLPVSLYINSLLLTSCRLIKVLLDVFQVAREHVSKFVTDESENILKTADSGFADAVQTIRQQRAEHVLSNFGPWEGNRSAITTAIVNAMSSNNREYQIYEIHDYLKAYYIIARKRFIDNIANSVIERELLGADGPLRVFTPALIGGLSDDELANIAAESPSTSVTREEYKGKVNRLKKALEATRKVGG